MLPVNSDDHQCKRQQATICQPEILNPDRPPHPTTAKPKPRRCSLGRHGEKSAVSLPAPPRPAPPQLASGRKRQAPTRFRPSIPLQRSILASAAFFSGRNATANSQHGAAAHLSRAAAPARLAAVLFSGKHRPEHHDSRVKTCLLPCARSPPTPRPCVLPSSPRPAPPPSLLPPNPNP
ncbi:hypothetical protein PVAP13_3KG209808 [Panicum virgatum]|uniref:Uncharacterized protein n=1 Tax=Panicum virgatum TaxID=38727 RepID=A0A8T0UXU8_PANVG|nr:hypothetical protein PVAP13_3KG209808 [Panicum virgatum]